MESYFFADAGKLHDCAEHYEEKKRMAERLCRCLQNAKRLSYPVHMAEYARMIAAAEALVTFCGDMKNATEDLGDEVRAILRKTNEALEESADFMRKIV